MKKLTRLILIASLAIAPLHADNDLWESKGPYVRIKRNDQDGSYVVFERTPDDRKLVKTTKDQNDKIIMQATYTRNAKGFLTAGLIHDGQGALIHRVVYGYDPMSGLLIAEDMFNARVRINYPPEIRDEDGGLKEMPIRRVYYFYDANGNQSKAISLVPHKGKTAEEVFTKPELKNFKQETTFDPEKSTSPIKGNPFEEEKKKKAPAPK